MTRKLRLRLAIAVTLGALVPFAAESASGARLDPSFGRDGSYAVATRKYDGETAFTQLHLAVAPDANSYVQQGSWILAFGPRGKPDPGFGKRGRLEVTSASGRLEEVGGIAVDQQGRVLTTGTMVPYSVPPEPEAPRSVTEAFVVRYLPDGRRDPTFGVDGEVDTAFGLPVPVGAEALPGAFRRPSVAATRIAVDPQGRLLVAADALARQESCDGDALMTDQAILARLRPDGSIDDAFSGGTGYVDLEGEVPTALTAGPGSSWATLAGSLHCSGQGRFGLPARISVIDETGEPSTTLDPNRRPLRAGPAFAVDKEGRFVYGEERPKHEVPARVFRRLANGDLDPSFGRDGSVGLGRVGGEYVGGIAIDAAGRVVVAYAATQLAITRLSATGRIEAGFGRNGALETRLPGTCLGEAIAIDSRGRILVAGQIWSGTLKTNKGVAIARFLPSR